MRSEDLRPTYLSIALDYPRLPRFTGDELPRFYADIHTRHPFEECDANGGKLYTEGERTLSIRREDLVLTEYVRDAFEVVRKNTVDLIAEAAKHFKITLFRVQSIKLRALWPVGEEFTPVNEALQEHMLKLSEDNYQFLGGNIETVPVEVVGDHEDPIRHWHVRLDTYGGDQTQMYISLEMYFYDPLSDANVISGHLELAHDFITHNVTRFVNSFMQ